MGNLLKIEDTEKLRAILRQHSNKEFFTRAELAAKVSAGEYIFVRGYTKKDGIHINDYYRCKPMRD